MILVCGINPRLGSITYNVQEGGMTKAELVDLIMAGTGVSKKDTALIINHILDNIGDALVKGDKVELRGFGSFKVKSRKPRLARNPRTGESVSVPAKQVPYFKASIEMKQKINGGAE
jgi:integration host factor subunit beta